MSNVTMTKAATPRPLGALVNAGAPWCGEIAGPGASAMPVSIAHRVRLTDVNTTPQNGRDGFVATKQAGPPRGVPR